MKTETRAFLISGLVERLVEQVLNNTNELEKLEKSGKPYQEITRGWGNTNAEITRTIDVLRSELMQLRRRYK